MGIKDGKLLFCHRILEQSKDNTISIREYSDRKIYEWLNNPFSIDFGSPALNLPRIQIDDSPRPNKISLYKFDPLPSAISVTSG